MFTVNNSEIEKTLSRLSNTCLLLYKEKGVKGNMYILIYLIKIPTCIILSCRLKNCLRII